MYVYGNLAVRRGEKEDGRSVPIPQTYEPQPVPSEGGYYPAGAEVSEV